MNYQDVRVMIAERVAQSHVNIASVDLYSMMFADDLQVIINMIEELDEATVEEQLSWEYAYLLGQAIGNLDTAESILHYFSTPMGNNAEPLADAFKIIEQKLM